MKWEVVENGYNKRLRLVGNGGLIIGHVEGCVYENDASWCAAIDGVNGRKNIGTYTTENFAKKAILAALAEIKEQPK